MQDLLEETPYPVAMAFYATFLDHDETAALEVLRRVPVDRGRGDPRPAHPRRARPAHRRGASATTAELVVVPGAGHSVNLTRTDVVDDALLRLLDRVEERSAARRLTRTCAEAVATVAASHNGQVACTAPTHITSTRHPTTCDGPRFETARPGAARSRTWTD